MWDDVSNTGSVQKKGNGGAYDHSEFNIFRLQNPHNAHDILRPEGTSWKHLKTTKSLMMGLWHDNKRQTVCQEEVRRVAKQPDWVSELKAAPFKCYQRWLAGKNFDAYWFKTQRSIRMKSLKPTCKQWTLQQEVVWPQISSVPKWCLRLIGYTGFCHFCLVDGSKWLQHKTKPLASSRDATCSTATPKSAQCMSWGSSCSEHLLDILACDDKFGRKACEVSSLTPSSPFGLVRSVLLHCSITHPGCASRLSSDFKGPTNVVEIQSGPDLLLATLSLRHGIVSRPLTANVIHTNRNYTEHVWNMLDDQFSYSKEVVTPSSS